MTAVFLRLVTVSLAAGCLIAVVLLLRPLARRALRFVMPLLWGLVALRLCCPFTLEFVHSPLPSADAAVTTLAMQLSAVEADEPATVYSDTAQSAVPVEHDLTALDFAAALWAVGVAVLTGCSLVSFFRLRRRLSTAVPLLEAGARVFQSDAIDTPCVVGWIHPRIYLPFALSREQLPYVLAHERAHVRRGDTWYKLAGYVLSVIYWFQPLVWVGYRLFCRDLEFGCDARVMSTLDARERSNYARALLGCATRPRLTFCPPAFGENGVRARVRAMLCPKKPLLWVTVAVLLFGVTAAVVLTSGRPFVAGIENVSVAGDKEMKLSLTDADLTRGAQSVTVRWTNLSAGERSVNGAFQLAKKTNGDWKLLDAVDYADLQNGEQDASLRLSPGQSGEITYRLSDAYGGMSDGDYRLQLSSCEYATGDYREAILNFTVTDSPIVLNGEVTVSFEGLNGEEARQMLLVRWRNGLDHDFTIGKGYDLERKTGDIWVNLCAPGEERILQALAIIIPSDGWAMVDYPVGQDFGPLAPGTYRFTADYPNDSGTPAEMIFTVE